MHSQMTTKKQRLISVSLIFLLLMSAFCSLFSPLFQVSAATEAAKNTISGQNIQLIFSNQTQDDQTEWHLTFKGTASLGKLRFQLADQTDRQPLTALTQDKQTLKADSEGYFELTADQLQEITFTTPAGETLQADVTESDQTDPTSFSGVAKEYYRIAADATVSEDPTAASSTSESQPAASISSSSSSESSSSSSSTPAESSSATESDSLGSNAAKPLLASDLTGSATIPGDAIELNDAFSAVNQIGNGYTTTTINDGSNNNIPYTDYRSLAGKVTRRSGLRKNSILPNHLPANPMSILGRNQRTGLHS
ncbi:hypothetical protein IV38_GL000864 [Lactobacillus selangorensis]|uniref:Uncharacterized protein n=1 Tax=Lactobacillus selangorensis TaxID=81857 RepID=A0A0R2FQM9_9LACO|nr:hypothetical protein [Lactobacillus selangorensis]KRN28661.1 hypothetical protein IV38_GL000864 [Lactobacillus selangorensis]KRN32929.1 hypothetical protein IV40_GL000989 [Lactobacillus selangorensis]